MTDIEQKILDVANEQFDGNGFAFTDIKQADEAALHRALYVAVERLEATEQEFDDFKQKVSDTIQDMLAKDGAIIRNYLDQFIIPAPKPDPLVEVMERLDGEWTPEEYAKEIRAALEARNLKIVEVKNDE